MNSLQVNIYFIFIIDYNLYKYCIAVVVYL